MNRREIPIDPLAALYAPIARPRTTPFIVAQLGQSLDGRIATPTGKSRDINGLCGLDHLHRLRSLADVVVVGVGTVVADDPRLTTRRVPGRSPARAVIDRTGRSPRDAKWLEADGCHRIVFTHNGAGWPDDVDRIGPESEPDIFEPARLIAALAARGHRTILIEGGASTISRFIDAGLVDRLHVCVAPIILGSGRPGLALRPIDGLEGALRPHVDTYLLDDGNILCDCDLRRTGEGGTHVGF
ncbi:riboflavin-specific deaminase-like protein [Ancylobacter aquaticus]|uniref:Riboflavin-specific deaminase-like protein n=1 Tax=Ancylobacter aquaticus TaxID=100 RepID=A0A4R1HQX4_ANCAQ|nr:dihydrofolate reductase family protein [Ancylobacter aquaticus]TCK23593.1 riboflavin-specific deaminase-like protein [Ancylobacter aquaticus]